MGIKGLMKLLSDECPKAIKEHDMNNLTGRKVAIDASMAMYQFLVAVRSSGPESSFPSMQLTNEAGEVTSHIQGMFNRSIKMMASGIKPVFVFDGKPPEMKGGELAKRTAKRAQAEAELAIAKESGDTEEIDKFSRRLVKVNRQHNEDCKELLRLMGVPVVEAPCEAEAQCAELAKHGKVYATATEDMDALTFRTPKLLRKLTFSSGQKQPIIEIDLDVALSGLGLTYEQFVDLCIMCGCDYCNTIKGIGPKTALKLMKQHGSLENVISVLRREKKYQIPEDWKRQRLKKMTDEPEAKDEEVLDMNNSDPAAPADEATGGATTGDDDGLDDDLDILEEDALNQEDGKCSENEEAVLNEAPDDVIGEEPEDSEYEIVEPLYHRARQLFFAPEVTPADEVTLKWEAPDEPKLREFLVGRMGFNAERVDSGIKRLLETQQKRAQQRMDSFFKPVAPVNPINKAADNSKKRKADVMSSGKPKSNPFAKKR